MICHVCKGDQHHVHCSGTARWQATAFQLGIVLSAAGLLVMLLTVLKSFGAAELLGQVLKIELAVLYRAVSAPAAAAYSVCKCMT